MLIRYLAIIIALFFSTHRLSAQIQVTTGVPPLDLIEGTFLGSGVDVLDITYVGSALQVGLFTNGSGNIGINNGLVMSTGEAENIGIPGLNDLDIEVQAGPSFPPDPQLNNIATEDLHDQVVYEIKFIPFSDTLRFTYVFASEEYPEFTCSQYNDVFGFFITGPNPGGPDYVAENIAIIPGTNLPVAINNVHNGHPTDVTCMPVNSQFYNVPSIGNFNFDAYLDVFIAEAIVVPCQEYTMKLAISDVGDGMLDSGIFLEAKSFGTGSLKVDVATESIDGVIAEGCSATQITLSTADPAEDTIFIDYSLLGDAVEGLDYVTNIVDPLVIPKGSTEVTVVITPLEDGLAEGFESVLFEVQRNICGRDTIPIFIRDRLLQPPSLPADTSICVGQSVELQPVIEENIPIPPIFTANDTIRIENSNFELPVISALEVTGQFGALDISFIERICIDIDHTFNPDLDIFLLAPCGNIMLLTSDNSSLLADPLKEDYKNTCFSPTAVMNIVDGISPFTGDFIPESDWDLIADGGCPTVGTWLLIIVDDSGAPGSPIPASGIGQLNGWSIEFASFYETNSMWSPGTDLSCVVCDSTIAMPIDTLEYFFSITDTYGCVETDSITVNIIDALPAPEANCVMLTDTSVTVLWSDLSAAEGYAISIDGGTFMNIGQDTSFTLMGLNPSEIRNFRIVGTSSTLNCDIDTAFVTCQSLACTSPDVSLPADSIVHITCIGETDGTIRVRSNEAVGTVTFTVNGVSNTTGIFNGLPPGIDTVYALSVFGCETKIAFEILEPVALTVTFDITPVPCIGNNIGAIRANPLGGKGPYIYEWSRIGGVVSTDRTLQNALPTSYTCIIEDANGCKVQQNVSIPIVDGIDISGNIVEPRCPWQSNGAINTDLKIDFPPFQVDWYDPDSIFFSNDEDINGLITGEYKMVLTDSLGCQDSMFFFIPNPPPVNAELELRNIKCFGEENGTVVANVTSGEAPFSYRLWGRPEQLERAFANLDARTHKIQIRDMRGCLSEVYEFELTSPDSFAIDLPDEIEIARGEILDLMPGIQGGVPDYSWLWSANTPVNDLCDTCSSQMITALEDVLVTALVTDSVGCEVEKNVVIRVLEDRIILVPTGFSPNGDFVNDQLFVHGSDSAIIEEFQVFDRWGGLIYEKVDFFTNETTGWDGKTDLIDSQSGTYIWKLVARFRDGTRLNFSGETSLIR